MHFSGFRRTTNGIVVFSPSSPFLPPLIHARNVEAYLKTRPVMWMTICHLQKIGSVRHTLLRNGGTSRASQPETPLKSVPASYRLFIINKSFYHRDVLDFALTSELKLCSEINLRLRRLSIKTWLKAIAWRGRYESRCHGLWNT